VSIGARRNTRYVNDWTERIASSRAELGASRLRLSTASGDLDRQIHYVNIFTKQIMPHFRQRAALDDAPEP